MRRIAVGSAVIAVLLSAGTAVAQDSDTGCSTASTPDLRALEGNEEALLLAVSSELMCLLDRQQPRLREAIQLTRRYFDVSDNPACQVLLLNAKLHVRAALQIEALAEPTAQQRDDLGRHWRAAWEMAAGISYAWAQHSTPDDEAFRSCVLPARQILKNYPSVTITIEPENITNYELWWDGFQRTDSLPRILPNKHHELIIDPPHNHRVTVWVDQGCARTSERKLTLYPSTRYRDPYGTHQIRVLFTDLDDPVPEDPVCGKTGKRRQAASDDGAATELRYYEPLFWGGIGAAGVGGIGLLVSLLQASSHESEGAALADPAVCDPYTPLCPVEAIQWEYDRRDAWQNWGAIPSGILLGLGVAATVSSFFLVPEEGGDAASDASLTPFVTTSGRSGMIGVQGRF